MTNVIIIFLFFITTWAHLVTSEEVNSENDNEVSNVPLDHVLKVYIYNVTNLDEFLRNESKPIVKELGPYVYIEKLENKNDSHKKVYIFNETLSSGSKDDVIVVPNVPFLNYVTLMPKGSNETNNWYRTLGEKSFVNVTVDELLFGYEDPLMTFAVNFANRPGEPLRRDRTFEGVINLLDPGSTDLIKYGLTISNEADGAVSLKKYASPNGCPTVTNLGKLNKNVIIHAYHQDFCRLIPLQYEKSISENENVTVYRYTPTKDILTHAQKLPENVCFCPDQFWAQCPIANLADCPYVAKYPFSFPHFYLSNDSYRTVAEGISPPDPEKHKFYIDVEQIAGKVINRKTRLQFNFLIPRTEGIDLMKGIPEMIFPIFWFEEGISIV